MAVRYKREYEDIIGDMVSGLKELDQAYIFLEIGREAWDKLGSDLQDECYKTMSHDIIYSLGFDSSLDVGKGSAEYDSDLAIIKIYDGDNCIHVINLN